MSSGLIFTVILAGISLAMDAFSVSVSNGMCMEKVKFKNALKIGLFFGVAQGIMPTIGFFAGILLENLIKSIDHWIAFFILSYIGFSMIREARKKIKNPEKNECKIITTKELFMQAVATSIDALAVGITFTALKNINIFISAALICVITLVLSIIGVYIGKTVGKILRERAEIFGGAVLIIIGIKILIEHLFGV